MSVQKCNDYGEELVFKCTDIYSMEVIGGKWRLPIIWTLSRRESMRYNELKKSLGSITNIMLTRCLQGLEAYGLVNRIEYDEVPPHVEYSLTDKCKELLPALEIINEWGRDLLKTYYGKKPQICDGMVADCGEEKKRCTDTEESSDSEGR